MSQSYQTEVRGLSVHGFMLTVHEFSHVSTGEHGLISEQLYEQERLAIEDDIEEAKAANDKKRIKELTRNLDIISQTLNARTYQLFMRIG